MRLQFTKRTEKKKTPKTTVSVWGRGGGGRGSVPVFFFVVVDVRVRDAIDDVVI